MPSFFTVNNLNLEGASLNSTGIFSTPQTAGILSNLLISSVSINLAEITDKETFSDRLFWLNRLSAASATDTILLNFQKINLPSIPIGAFTINIENVNEVAKIGNPSNGMLIVEDSPFPEFESYSIGLLNKTASNHILIRTPTDHSTAQLGDQWRDIKSGFYTIEVWVKATESPVPTRTSSSSRYFVVFHTSGKFTTSSNFPVIQLIVGGVQTDNTELFAQFYYRAAGTTGGGLGSTIKMKVNQWHHIAVSVGVQGNRNRARFFVDGIDTNRTVFPQGRLLDSTTQTQASALTYTSLGWNSSTEFNNSYIDGAQGFRGYISNFCYSAGAKYDNDFTPVRAPIQLDSTTRILYKYPYDETYLGANYTKITTQYPISSFTSSKLVPTYTWAAFKLSEPIKPRLSDFNSATEPASALFATARLSFTAPSANIFTLAAGASSILQQWAGWPVYRMLFSSLTNQTTSLATNTLSTALTGADTLYILGTHTSQGLIPFSLTAVGDVRLNIPNIHIGSGGSFILPADRNTTLTLTGGNMGMRVGTGGKFISNLSSRTLTHQINLLRNADFIVEPGGYLELKGASKQATYSLSSSLSQNQTQLSLASSPQDWQINDQIYLPSNTTSNKTNELVKITSIDLFNNSIGYTPKNNFLHNNFNNAIPDVINITKNVIISALDTTTGATGRQRIFLNTGSNAVFTDVAFDCNHAVAAILCQKPVLYYQNYPAVESSTSNIIVSSCSFRRGATGTPAGIITVTEGSTIIKNNTFYNFGSVSIYIPKTSYIRDVKNITLENNIFFNNSSLGTITVDVSGDNININDNIIIDQYNGAGLLINSLSTSSPSVSVGNITGFRVNNWPLVELYNIQSSSINVVNINNYFGIGVYIQDVKDCTNLTVNNVYFSATTAVTNTTDPVPKERKYGSIVLNKVTASSININNIQSFNISTPIKTVLLYDTYGTNININNITAVSASSAVSTETILIYDLLPNLNYPLNGTINVSGIYIDIATGPALMVRTKYCTSVDISNIYINRLRSSNAIIETAYSDNLININMDSVSTVDSNGFSLYTTDVTSVSTINISNIFGSGSGIGGGGFYITTYKTGQPVTDVNPNNLTLNISNVNFVEGQQALIMGRTSHPTCNINLNNITAVNMNSDVFKLGSTSNNTIISAKNITAASRTGDNISFSLLSKPIEIINFDNIKCIDNSSSVGKPRYGIRFDQVSAINTLNITNSLISGASGAGIHFQSTTCLNINFNNISAINNAQGLYLMGGPHRANIDQYTNRNVIIKNSYFNNNKSLGISVAGANVLNFNITDSQFLNNSGVNIYINDVKNISSLSASNLYIGNNIDASIGTGVSGMVVFNCNSAVTVNINNNNLYNLAGGIQVKMLTSLPLLNLTNNLIVSSKGHAIDINLVSSLSTSVGSILISGTSAIGHILNGINISNLFNRFNVTLNNNLMSSCNIGAVIQNNSFPISTTLNNLTATDNLIGISLQNITSHNSTVSSLNNFVNLNRSNGFLISGVSAINNISFNNTTLLNNSANGLLIQNVSSPGNILIDIFDSNISDNNQNGTLIRNISCVSAIRANNSTFSENTSAGIYLANLSATSLFAAPLSTNFTQITANNNLIGIEAYNITANMSSVVLNDNIAHGIKARVSNGNTEIKSLTSLMQSPTAANTTSIIFNTNSSAGDFITSDLSPALPFTENLYNSVYFHNNKDSFVQINNTAQLNLSSNDFTIEAWVYVKEVSPTDGGLIVGVDDGVVRVADLLCTRTAPGRGFSNWGLYIENNYKLKFSTLLFDNDAAGGWNGVELFGPTLTRNTWNHIAITRSANTFRLYVNGSQVTTATKAITIPHRSNLPLRTCSWTVQTRPGWGNASCTGGTVADIVDAYLNGYISNLRIITKQSLYNNSSFDVPTEPLTRTSQGALPQNVALLTFQNFNFYKDNSQYNTRIDSFNINDAVSVNSAPISPAAIDKWSCYLGSNTNSINLPVAFDNALGPFANSIKSFEAWVYFKSITATSFISNFAAGNVQGRYSFGTNLDNTLNFVYSTNTNTVTSVSSNIPIETNKWTHVAVVVDATIPANSIVKFFTNGVLTQRSADLTSHTVLASNTKIGGVASINNNTLFNNVLISNLHLAKQALYNLSFNPTLTPISSTSNTVLLTLKDNRFIDGSSNNFTLTVSNTPSIEWSSPFISQLSGSYYFNGYSDYITISSSNLPFPAGVNIPFTIEAWIFPTDIKSRSAFVSDKSSSNMIHNALCPGNTIYNTASIPLTGSGYSVSFACFNNPTWTIASAYKNIQLYKWQHIAATYTGSQILVFIDGEIAAIKNVPKWINKNIDTMYIGKKWDDLNADTTNIYFCGYMNNIRYIRGTALYRDNFTPQKDNFKCISNTKFLVAAEHGRKFIHTNHNNLQSNIYLVSSINTYPTLIQDSVIGGIGQYNAPAIVFEESHLSNFYSNNSVIRTSALNVDFVSMQENNSGSYIFNKNILSNPDSINWGLTRGYRDNSLHDKGISLANYNNIPFSNKRILPAGVISSYTRKDDDDGDVLGGSTVSEKVQPHGNRYLRSSSKFIPIKQNETAIISVYVKKSITPSYKGSQPQLILNQNPLIGFNSKRILYTHTAANGVWETYTATLPAPTTDGIAEIYIECAGDTNKGYININGWTVSKQ